MRHQQQQPQQQHQYRLLHRVLAAAFYGVASFSITVVNKSVLTGSGFPSFQVISTAFAHFSYFPQMARGRR